jgi:hypothetical protein
MDAIEKLELLNLQENQQVQLSESRLTRTRIIDKMIPTSVLSFRSRRVVR